MKKAMEKCETFLEFGGTKKEIILDVYKRQLLQRRKYAL